jgi:hypothetical protein
MKFGGYWALAFKTGAEIRLVWRNRTLFNNDCPQLIESLRLLRAKTFIIDAALKFRDG